MGKWDIFLGSDNWWIENEKAWFVEVTNNMLCCLDLITNECELMVKIPDTNINTFRLTPYCVKYGTNIFCLPGCGECVWVYDLECRQFSQINIDNRGKIQLSLDFWVYDSRLFAVAGELKKIIEINLCQKKIDNYYTILKESRWTRSVRVGDEIYCLQTKMNRIYCFNLGTKKTKNYFLPNSECVESNLYTINYDGKQFWLSGYGKEICVWNKENNTLKIIDEFPRNFGIYNFNNNDKAILDYKTRVYDLPTFLFSVVVAGNIWFIPFQTNEIICVNTLDYRLFEFVINEEDETKESLCLEKRGIAAKYFLECVRHDRYIVLYSIKNKRILEIDAKKFTYRWMDYQLGSGCLGWYDEKNKGLYHEKDVFGRMAYNVKVKTAGNNIYHTVENKAGADIYKAMLLQM